MLLVDIPSRWKIKLICRLASIMLRAKFKSVHENLEEKLSEILKSDQNCFDVWMNKTISNKIFRNNFPMNHWTVNEYWRKISQNEREL